jgi:hypothetical protein
VLLVRHIFEHAHKPAQFAAALKELAKPNGYVVFEIPDCERALDLLDYSTLWEEHVLYFTPATYKQAIGQCGFSLFSYHSFPYTFENSLVSIGRVEPRFSPPALPADELEREKQRTRRFSGKLQEQRDRYARYFAGYRKTRGRVALFGAGHLACTFVNLLGLKEHMQFVVDDNPNKRGLFLPGCRLPIVGSDALLAQGTKLCLLTVAAESEEKVIRKNEAFVAAGGEFVSIYPASKHALKM